MADDNSRAFPAMPRQPAQHQVIVVPGSSQGSENTDVPDLRQEQAEAVVIPDSSQGEAVNTWPACQEAVLKCFPNICPEYLLQVATRLEFDSETIITHILDEQERGVHYPVQPNPVKRKRKREETPEEPNEPDKNDARLLNKNDPFTVQYRQAARHLIMAAFPTVYAPDVDRIFKENNYLLSGTYKAIEELLTGEGGPKLRVKKVVSKLDDHIYDDSHKDGEKLALAEYRTALSQTEAKKAEERNLERARAAGEIEECGCCFGEYALNRMIHCSGEVLHWFCRDCSRKMAEVAVGEGKHQLQCMSMDECEAEFAPDQRAIFLDKKLARALEELERDASLRMAGIENLARCPFCPYAAEYPPADQNKEFECQNPDCGVVSCRLCEKETHIPKTCKEAADDGYSARHQIEEAMSLALIRKCNKCGAPFIKESGCNKMTCTSPGCHNVQCYICSQSCGYDHFNDRKRGGKEGNCPLFDPDVEQRHEEEVRAAQEKARQEIASANPGVDPKMLDVEFSERIKADDEERKKARELARAQAQAPAPRGGRGPERRPHVNAAHIVGGLPHMPQRNQNVPNPDVALREYWHNEQIQVPNAQPWVQAQPAGPANVQGLSVAQQNVLQAQVWAQQVRAQEWIQAQQALAQEQQAQAHIQPPWVQDQQLLGELHARQAGAQIQAQQQQGNAIHPIAPGAQIPAPVQGNGNLRAQPWQQAGHPQINWPQAGHPQMDWGWPGQNL